MESTARALNNSYISPAPEGKFPIIAINAFPWNQKPSLQSIVNLLMCGFNTVVYNGSKEECLEFFQILNNNRLSALKVITQPPLMTTASDYRVFVNTLKNYTNLGGWMCDQNPNMYEIGGVNNAVLNPYGVNLKTIKNLIETEDSNHMCFPMLQTDMTLAEMSPYKTFSSYIQFVRSKLDVSVWSVLFKPIWNELVGTFEPTNQNPDEEYLYYVQNLGITTQISCHIEEYYQIYEKLLSTHLPIWGGICVQQSVQMSWEGNVEKELPVLYYETLRYQVFNALAYGAQGIFYWGYGEADSEWKTKKVDGQSCEYMPNPMLLAPVNNRNPTYEFNGEVEYDKISKNNLTYQWYLIRKINQELAVYKDTNDKNVESIFLGASVIDVVHTPLSKLEPYFAFNHRDDTSDAATQEDKKNLSQANIKIFNKADGFAFVSNIVCSGAGVVMSWLKKKGKNYLLIVNHDPFYSQTINITYDYNKVVDDITFRDKTNSTSRGYINNLKKKSKSFNPNDVILYTGVIGPGGYIIFNFEE